jgi:hypothetical protein
MTLLTDSEQIRVLDEMRTSTQTRMRAVMKELGLDTVPKDIQDLRKKIDERYKREGVVGDAAKRALLGFLGGIGWIKK